ncbi:LOG family protein [Solimonas soli]|uniref:LOG family protein n=1 Tax=Solimonas soli TaxID=413479 RepID=UPI000481133B|nr:LOG family protein [Solimonas soli]
MPDKAYKNEQFLMSEEARGVRILCEYVEPEQRFRRTGVRNTVAFFGSARLRLGRGSDGRDWYAEAAQLAEKLARWTLETHTVQERFYVCTGGGPGIMEAAHVGGGRVDQGLNVGLNISLPFEPQRLNEHIDDAHAFQFHYFFMRKFWLVKLARGAVFFPGGFGTLDELFELLTLTQTHKVSRIPILLYGRSFWEGLIDFGRLVERGLISPEDVELFRYCDDADAAFELLRSELRPHPPEESIAASP